MKKRPLLLFSVLLALLIASPTVLMADGGNPRLVVWKKDLSKVYYQLSEKPVTTFSNNMLVIKTNSATIEYPLADIQRYTYEGVETGIESIESDNSMLVKQEKDKLSLRNLKAGEEVRLYNSSGRLLQVVKSNGTEPVIISLSSRPQGVYIVKSGKETIKLMKR